MEDHLWDEYSKYNFFHSISFQTHVVVTSQHEPCRQLPKVTAEEREFDEVKKGRVALNEGRML